MEISHCPNPRIEAEEHYYNAKHSRLLDLGLVPHALSATLLDSLVGVAIGHADRVREHLIEARVPWARPAAVPIPAGI